MGSQKRTPHAAELYMLPLLGFDSGLVLCLLWFMNERRIWFVPSCCFRLHVYCHTAVNEIGASFFSSDSLTDVIVPGVNCRKLAKTTFVWGAEFGVSDCFSDG